MSVPDTGMRMNPISWNRVRVSVTSGPAELTRRRTAEKPMTPARKMIAAKWMNSR
ncbi:hypothetical protein [Dietzia sp.]|uniref:hypothetical protein n=1 Tax=Dietzia sp. TaxID=1871616 RepID=UPI002FDB0DFA